MNIMLGGYDTLRNKMMLLNAIVVLGTTILNIVLGMIQVRAMLLRYGSTINGLLQTSNQLAGYVSLL